ncbi:MAG: CehA/McbA family metallohydrolase [Acidobacteria bacterium]|nr:CehA/McbA family metallohydrolase [Acidobacteriota bacterium]
MSRRTTTRWLATLPLLVGAVLAWRVIAWHPLSVSATAVTDGFVRVSGVAHIHTTHSDGGGTIADVASAAAAARLDFVIVTDHNSLAGKPLEGYGEAGVLTIVGTEIANHEGHLLAFGLPAPTYRFSGDGLDTLRDLDDLGGLTFAAHPESPREDLRWTGWRLPGDWGIEILNGDSQWRAAGWTSLLGAALRYPLNSDYSLLRLMRRPAALSRWDDLLARRRVPAIAGADAHGTLRGSPWSFRPWPSYEAVFRIAQNYVLLERPLTGNAPADTAAILAALGRGRAYIGVGALAPADRFFFLAERDGGRWTMGDTLASGDPVRLQAGGALPTGARITLYRNGVAVTTADGPLAARVTEPGVYRVEVHVPGWDMPWIVSNPIYVLTEPERERRARAAELPAPVVADAAAILDPFDSDSTFAAVADDSTRQDLPFIDPDGGPDGSSAARIAFRLGEPSTEHPSPFASLGSYQPRDLAGRHGLVFAVRSDDTYRFWVQVRDRNPETPEGTESWFASVKTSNAWRTVTLPFSRLRSVDPHTDGTLDLADIEAIVFLVDIGAVPPGTEGVIWLDDLGVY